MFDRGEESEPGAPEVADVSTPLSTPSPADVGEVESDAIDPEGDPDRVETASGGSASMPDQRGVGSASASAELDDVETSESVLPTDDGDARFPRPTNVRGLYVNAWAAGSRTRMTALLEVVRTTEVNALVIDIKDASGYVSHATELEFAHEIGSTGEIRIRDLPGLLDQLETEGIYPIARIVVVKDPILAAARPELTIQDTAGGSWIDGKGIIWLNPHDPEVWDYHVSLAREVAEMGFPEIQWDYIRFPDAPRSELDRAVYPGADGRPMAEVIRSFLEYGRGELAYLEVELTADVFGVTTSAARDVGIGQVWESFIDVIDVALPMVYPSHYWTGSFGIDSPNAYPYEIVRGALDDAMRRSLRVEGAGLTRPWLQDFTLGAPAYEAPEVRAQIQATYDAGFNEWILWNPGSHYTVDALQPVGGFVEEPLMRIGSQIVPASRRWEFVDSAEVIADTARARR